MTNLAGYNVNIGLAIASGAAAGGITGAAGAKFGALGAFAAAPAAGAAGAAISGGDPGMGAAIAAATAAFAMVAYDIATSRSDPRALKTEEIDAVKKVLGNKVNYSGVKVFNSKYYLFQGEDYVMAPDGNIYWPGECGNLASCGGIGVAKTFIHEMTHVMQNQHGVNVLGQGLLLQAAKFLSLTMYDPYSFTYDPSRSFRSYNIEQQGDIAVGIYMRRYPNNIDY